MCILFFYLNSKPTSKFKLILASNRDELLSRPAKECHFWDQNISCIGGQDLTEGKEGGTWLAMNKSGKIAALLNIMQLKKDMSPIAKGRGSLVADFVSSKENTKSYFVKIDKEKDQYNKFKLITLCLKEDRTIWEGFHYSNMMDNPEKLEDGIHGFGNHTPQISWNKVEYGKAKFNEIIDNYSDLSTKDALIDKLLLLLNDSTPYWPDEGILLQANDRPVEILKCLSSIFVKLYEVNYGTRVNTLILIDQEGNVDFVERTLQYSMADQDLSWKIKKFSFTLETK